MTAPEWSVRAIRATKRDRERLASFACADRAVAWQAEVENFVRNDLFEWRYAPLAKNDDPRVLMLFRNKDELVGVAAHEQIRLVRGSETYRATKLEVLAIATEWQGRKFASDERVSDVLMSAVMADVSTRVPARYARILGVVHEDNVRSIKLCERHGFTDEMSRPEDYPTYRRLLTAHRTSESSDD